MIALIEKPIGLHLGHMCIALLICACICNMLAAFPKTRSGAWLHHSYMHQHSHLELATIFGLNNGYFHAYNRAFIIEYFFWLKVICILLCCMSGLVS